MGEYVVNPTAEEQRAAASCFVTIASTFEKVVMIETEANESPEPIVLECIRIAHETNMEIVKFINGIVAEIGKPKFTFEKAAVNHDLLDELCEYGMDQIEYALDTDDKNVREERLTAARRDFSEKFAEKYEDFDVNIEVCLYKMQKKWSKKWLLAGKRVDGRGMDEIRPLAAEVGILPRVHGSGLFTPAVRPRFCPSAPSTPCLPPRNWIPSIRKRPSGISITTTSRRSPRARPERAARLPAVRSATALWQKKGAAACDSLCRRVPLCHPRSL